MINISWMLALFGRGLVWRCWLLHTRLVLYEVVVQISVWISKENVLAIIAHRLQWWMGGRTDGFMESESRNSLFFRGSFLSDLRLFCDGGQVWCGWPAPSLHSYTEAGDGPHVTHFCPGRVKEGGEKNQSGVIQRTGEGKAHTITKEHAREGQVPEPLRTRSTVNLQRREGSSEYSELQGNLWHRKWCSS